MADFGERAGTIPLGGGGGYRTGNREHNIHSHGYTNYIMIHYDIMIRITSIDMEHVCATHEQTSLVVLAELLRYANGDATSP